MTACQGVDIAIHQEHVLSDEDEIDAHVPMGFKGLDIVGHLGTVGTWHPIALHLIEHDNGTGFGPFVPVAQAKVFAAVDLFVIQQKAVDIGVDGTRRCDLIAVGVGVSDGRPYERLQELFNCVKGFARSRCAGDDGNHGGSTRIDAEDFCSALYLPEHDLCSNSAQDHAQGFATTG